MFIFIFKTIELNSAIVKMPEKKRIQEMQTQYQYIMMMDNPEKAATFSQNRKKYGSCKYYYAINFKKILKKLYRLGIPWFSHRKLPLHS